jgi:hypothetical protein
MMVSQKVLYDSLLRITYYVLQNTTNKASLTIMTKAETADVEELPNATLVEPLLPSPQVEEEEAEPVVALDQDPIVVGQGMDKTRSDNVRVPDV